MAVTSKGVLFGPASGRPTTSSPHGRVCRALGCSTILSIYNHSAWCSLHEQPTSRINSVLSR
jgi:hypothetical protein